MQAEITHSPVVVVDYGAGNLRSVVRALDFLGAHPQPTADPDTVARAEIVVFPGVGATRDTMDTLDRTGLGAAVRSVVARGAPLLGICVGMQVLLEASEEFGQHPCLGLVRGAVRRLPDGQKVPQIGWNQVHNTAPASPLFAGIADGSDFYFNHSFFCDLTDPGDAVAHTEYGRSFASAIQRGKLAAVQFHPEKSGRNGLRLLRNFVVWANGADPGN